MPNLQITLADVITKYGEPTTVWVAPEGVPESPKTSMIALFENHQIRLDFNDEDSINGTYDLEPSARVKNVVYYSNVNNDLKAFLQPWHGYGKDIIDDNSH